MQRKEPSVSKNPCPPHLLVLRDNGDEWCIGCERVIDLCAGHPDDRTAKPLAGYRNHPRAKLSCMACIVNPLGFKALHVCGQQPANAWVEPDLEECDRVAESAGVA
jgi:hypothetical protein